MVATVPYTALATGAAEYTAVLSIDKARWGSGSLTLVVDDGSLVDECEEGDNTLDLGAWPCD